MMLLDWNNPKITASDLDSFLRSYLLDLFDGIVIDDNKVVVNTFQDLSQEQERYIRDWFYSLNDIAINIKSLTPIETTTTSPKNEHCMQPWGCVKGAFVSEDLCCPITLSNKSEDGCTFDYVCSKALCLGNYVFMDDFCTRSWVRSYTETAVTFEMPVLSNGVGVYSIGYYKDELVRDWKPRMFLWGLYLHSINHSNDDFLELSVVDENDLLKNDEICQFLFGVNAIDADPYIMGMGFENIGEFGSHWTKYYDEQWVINAQGKLTTPDGAPGELMPGLFLRMKYFPTEAKSTKTHFYIDYSPTSKD